MPIHRTAHSLTHRAGVDALEEEMALGRPLQVSNSMSPTPYLEILYCISCRTLLREPTRTVRVGHLIAHTPFPSLLVGGGVVVVVSSPAAAMLEMGLVRQLKDGTSAFPPREGERTRVKVNPSPSSAPLKVGRQCLLR